MIPEYQRIKKTSKSLLDFVGKRKTSFDCQFNYVKRMIRAYVFT